jgi:hypothetical protein
MGLQYLALPGTTMRNPVFGADVAGIVISSPITDWLAATAFWIRPFDNYRNGDTQDGALVPDRNISDAVDVFGLVLPITMDGWSLTPYFLYGWVGAQSGLYEYVFVNASNNAPQQQLVTADDSRAKAWWLGTNFDLTMFDPFRFQLDVIYGHLNRADVQPYGSWVNGSWINRNNGNWTDFNTNWGTEGWYIGAVLDYKLDFMTPGIFGWWASGDSKSDYEEGMLGRLPVVGIDDGWGMNSFGNVGFYYNNHDENAVTSWTGVGTWGIGIQLADITFIENLSHTIRLSYYRGTNDPDIVKDYGNAPGPGGAAINAAPFKYAIDPLYMTSNDYAWEVNFDHKYQIYENLTTVLELGYIRLHSDRDTWENYASGDKENDNAWKAELMFRYSF